MASTNVISQRSIIEKSCQNVKRWNGGEQIERRVGSGLMVAERRFRKVMGIKRIPALLAAMVEAAPLKPAAKTAAVA